MFYLEIKRESIQEGKRARQAAWKQIRREIAEVYFKLVPNHHYFMPCLPPSLWGP